MILIYTVDENYGILFNNRRVSRDREVVKDIFSITMDKRLFMDEYSVEMFENAILENDIDVSDNELIVEPDPISVCGANDVCFVEKEIIDKNKCNIEEVILYKWNRLYPSDVQFDESLLEGKELVESYDFQGYSHERITREIWR